MQHIFLLRHSEAEDIKDTPEKDDFYRKLTKEGKQKTKKLSSFFNDLNEEINLALSSPYLRARETAEIFTDNLPQDVEFKTVDFLSCGTSSKEILNGLLPYKSYKNVLLVGHSPDLELFLGRLIGAERVKLKKGALAKVLLENSVELNGELQWLVTPQIANKLSKG